MLITPGRQKQRQLAALLLFSFLWLQGNVLWHDTIHAGHHHGTALSGNVSLWQYTAHFDHEQDTHLDLMCTLDGLIPEIGTGLAISIYRMTSTLAGSEPSVMLTPAKAPAITGYLCRGPPPRTG